MRYFSGYYIHAQVGDSSLQVGAAVSLSNLIGQLRDNQSKSSSFEHMVNHLSKIANVPVRNVGTWSGNLMLTHHYDNFPSDVFTVMAGVGAKVTIGMSPLNPEISSIISTNTPIITSSCTASLSDLSTSELTLWDFLKQDMSKSVRG